MAALGWLTVAALILIVLQMLVMMAYGLAALPERQTPLMWLNFVTGPLILFLAGSIAGLRSAHPLAWILGVLAAVMTLPEILGAGRDSAIGHAQLWIVFTLIGPYNGPTGIAPRSSAWGSLWVTCALGGLLATAVAVVLVARVRRPS